MPRTHHPRRVAVHPVSTRRWRVLADRLRRPKAAHHRPAGGSVGSVGSLLLVGSVLAATACSASSESPPVGDGPISNGGSSDSPVMVVDTAADLVAVRARVDAYLAAVSNRDTSAVRSQFASSGPLVWIESGTVQYRSVDDVLKGMAGLPPDAPIATTLADYDAQLLGADGAHAWSAFTTSVGTGDGAFTFGGQISFLLTRADGEWRIAGGHTSSPASR